MKGLSASERLAQKKIRVIEGDPTGKFERKVRQTLRDSFTQDEIKKMGRIDIKCGKIPYDNRAVFYGKYDNNEDVTEIIYNPKVVDEDDITHEFIHALKENDRSRKGYAAAGSIRQKKLNANRRNDIRNIEEATVVAEAAVRTKKPSSKASGYYEEIPGIGRDLPKMKRAYDQDRKTLLDEPKTPIRKTKGVKGKRSIEKVNKNFPKTQIAQKKKYGRSAIKAYGLLRK